MPYIKLYFKSKNLNIGKSYARNNASIKQFKMTAYKWKGFHANQVIHCLCPIRVFPFCWPVSGSHTQIYIMKIKRIFLILYQSMVKENHPVNVMQYHNNADKQINKYPVMLFINHIKLQVSYMTQFILNLVQVASINYLIKMFWNSYIKCLLSPFNKNTKWTNAYILVKLGISYLTVFTTWC